MPIVSNTSPLLNLAIINHLNLLEQQFGEIIIPSIVLAELKLEINYPGTNLIQQSLAAQWLRVVELKNNHLVGVLGVLLRAKFDGQIPSIEAVMQSLQREAGFFIADDLFEAILIEAGER